MNYEIQSKKQTLKSMSNIYNPTVNIGANYNKTDLDIRSTGIGATSMGYVKFGIKLYNEGKKILS